MSVLSCTVFSLWFPFHIFYMWSIKIHKSYSFRSKTLLQAIGLSLLPLFLPCHVTASERIASRRQLMLSFMVAYAIFLPCVVMLQLPQENIAQTFELPLMVTYFALSWHIADSAGRAPRRQSGLSCLTTFLSYHSML